MESKQEPQEIAVIENPIALMKKPEELLADAKLAAQALQKVIAGKRKPVMFNGEQYLEFEDWQTCARFYGLAAKVINTKYVEFGETKGWEAHAVVINTANGAEISAADSMCLNDEPNWSRKPLFQLRSMAQTRACAKALRNVLAWVVVLAGYKPTPAEEIQDMAQTQAPRPAAKPQSEGNGNLPDDQLGNWVMPKGKFANQRLSQIYAQENGGGRAVGKEYLEWCADNWKGQEQEVITRFLRVMEEPKTIHVD